jgi:putative DNA primase/helicase
MIANRLLSNKTHAAVISLTRAHPRIPAQTGVFDRDRWLLNTRGGVVNLKDGSMRPARREDFFTKRTPVGPAEMPTPIFDQCLRDIMGWHLPAGVCKCSACLTSCKQPDEKRLALHRAEAEALCAYLLRFYGYCLTGDVSTHVLMIQIGPGGNGKGLLNGFIGEDILGISPTGYAADIPMEALLMARNERHPTELMCLLVRDWPLAGRRAKIPAGMKRE